MSAPCTLVLTAAPGHRAISDTPIAIAVAALPDPESGGDDWLANGDAWQATTMVDGDDSAVALRRALSNALAPFPIDINLLPAGPSGRKRLLVADMESTIIGEEMLDELADYVGLRDKISQITERAMKGELAFEPALRERVALLAGLDARILDEVYQTRVTLMPGAETLINTMKANGAYCALVSGGFTVFTGRVAARLGFDEHQANVLEIENGKLTGRVREPILGREAKLGALKRIAAARGLVLAETLAVGDGANDLDMIRAAGLGVAFRAKPKVQEAARALPNGAVVTHGDLTALLYLQGYSRDQFVG